MGFEDTNQCWAMKSHSPTALKRIPGRQPQVGKKLFQKDAEITPVIEADWREKKGPSKESVAAALYNRNREVMKRKNNRKNLQK